LGAGIRSEIDTRFPRNFFFAERHDHKNASSETWHGVITSRLAAEDNINQFSASAARCYGADKRKIRILDLFECRT